MSAISVESRGLPLASFLGHSQILSCSCEEKPIFLHSCKVKSRRGLGTRLDLFCIATILKLRAATTELNMANLVEMQRERKVYHADRATSS